MNGSLASPLAAGSYAPPAPARQSDPDTVPADVKATIRVLIVDDDRALRDGCASVLQVEGYNVTVIGRGDEALDVVARRRFDLILLDLYMTPVSGIEILKAALAANESTLVIMVTGNPSVASSIDALRLGAWEYLPKPFSGAHLQVLLGRATHAVLQQRASVGRPATRDGIGEKLSLLGVSPTFRQAVELARKVATTNASVMISGESGTGKELIAQFIHRNSRRAAKRLVPVNCAALPESLLESEMFGHRKGAFTGADRDKTGLLETAHGGTLFLDELTEMSLPLQAKLLRVIQDGVVRRVGSETQDAVVDVRFISATNRDPHEAVAAGALRDDLYYRLRVVPIQLPPLRERPEDIPLLARHFLSHYWQRHRQLSDPLPMLSEATIDFLRSRPWRGNVRELQNVVEHLAVLLEPGQTVEPSDVPLHEMPAAALAEELLPAGILDEAYHPAWSRVAAHFHREYLSRLVRRSGGNMSRAARMASIDRTTLYRLFDKHSIRRADSSEITLG
jgi:DNA-binding NtrC family response regulator